MKTGGQIAVIGGAGFIGSATARRLHDAGYQPIIFDSLITGRAENVTDYELVKGDITDIAAVTNFFRDHQFSAIVMLAGLIEVAESMKLPGEYLRVNVTGMMTITAEAARAKLPVVFSSSAAVYGQPEQTPITETAATHPINPYGSTKLICEQILASYQMSAGLPWVGLRYFNAAGSYDGVGDRSSSHLLPLASRAVIAGQPVRIFGTDYQTIDGTCVRDYVHVADLAAAHVLAITKLLEGVSLNQAINLGGGRGLSVIEMIEELEEACGHPVERTLEGRRPGDPATLLADIKLAADLLGWRPDHTVEQIVADAFAFERSQSA